MAELRAACSAAVGRSSTTAERVVVARSPGQRGQPGPRGHGAAGSPGRAAPARRAPLQAPARAAVDGCVAARGRASPTDALLVMADGSARRGEKAPGHLHPDAIAFDDAIDAGPARRRRRDAGRARPRAGDGAVVRGRAGLPRPGRGRARPRGPRRGDATPTRRTASPGGSPAGTSGPCRPASRCLELLLVGRGPAAPVFRPWFVA